MGFAGRGNSIEYGAKDHTEFIRKLLPHPVLKETVNENFPNGLSPLDLAWQFELPDIDALIEVAGGRPGVWAEIPQDVYAENHMKLLAGYVLMNHVCQMNKGGQEARKVFLSILGSRQSVEGEIRDSNESQLAKAQVLGKHPNLRDVVKYVLPGAQVRNWKAVGLALSIGKSTLDQIKHQFSSDYDCYLETLSYWIEQDSSATWKTLLDALGHFETKHAVDELTDKIVSVLGEDHLQVCVNIAACCVR